MNWMNNKGLNIYMCGCMSYFYSNKEYDKALEWRGKLAQKLLDCNAEICKNHFDWFDPTINFEDNVKTANAKTVVQQNNYYLDKCDVLVANLEKLEESPGSIYEIFYYGIKNKPVIAFGDTYLINSPHISECITVKLEDIDKIVDYLMSYYIH